MPSADLPSTSNQSDSAFVKLANFFPIELFPVVKKLKLKLKVKLLNTVPTPIPHYHLWQTSSLSLSLLTGP